MSRLQQVAVAITDKGVKPAVVCRYMPLLRKLTDVIEELPLVRVDGCDRFTLEYRNGPSNLTCHFAPPVAQRELFTEL